MKDRAMQALLLLTLDPVSETLADPILTALEVSVPQRMPLDSVSRFFPRRNLPLGSMREISKVVLIISIMSDFFPTFR